ncbi:glycosyltransferase [Treponema sp. Marseille-Q3903]|nr:glycosyltransferase [Treponema sp. Marseille-Q3903]MBC6713666.1 glycosyltransferase [Treponema sp. Marseille-Q3903]
MISIAMTTFNGEKYLRSQLDSILNQTHTDFELIICDDCSTDSTVYI